MYSMVSIIGGLLIFGAVWAYWNFSHQKSKITKAMETEELESKIDESIKELSNLIDKLNQIKNGERNGYNTRKTPFEGSNKGFIY